MYSKLAHFVSYEQRTSRASELLREYSVRQRQYLELVNDTSESLTPLLRRSTWDACRKALNRLRADRRLTEVADAARRSTLLKILLLVYIVFLLSVIE